MKIFILFLFTFCINLNNSIGQGSFQKTYGAALSGVAGGQQTYDGGFIMAGNFYANHPYNPNIALIKTDPFGDTSWVRIYDFTSMDMCGYVRQTTDSGFIVTGRSVDSLNGFAELIFVFKTDKNGNLSWSKFYGGQRGYWIEQTNDGGYILIGEDGLKVIKTDMFGDTVWTRDYQTYPQSGAIGSYIHQTHDRGYVFGGYYYTPGGMGSGASLNKVDSLGNVIWAKHYVRTGYHLSYAMQITSDGGFIIAGSTNVDSPYEDLFLIKTNSTGDTLWTRTYGTIYRERVAYVNQTNDGGYLLSGGNMDLGLLYVVRTDSDGNLLWSRYYQFGWRIFCQETSDGGCAFIGSTIIKTDSNGIGCSYGTANTLVGHPNFSVYNDSVTSQSINSIVTNFPVSIGAGSSVTTICFSTGIIEPENSEISLLISPNPFNSEIRIGNTEEGEIVIYDLSGKEILKHHTIYGETQIKSENISPGIYFLHYKCGKGVAKSKILKF